MRCILNYWYNRTVSSNAQTHSPNTCLNLSSGQKYHFSHCKYTLISDTNAWFSFLTCTNINRVWLHINKVMLMQADIRKKHLENLFLFNVSRLFLSFYLLQITYLSFWFIFFFCSKNKKKACERFTVVKEVRVLLRVIQ